MPRGIDQVKLINLTVLRFVAQRRRLRLDGNAAFALKIHAVEDLLAHFAVGEASAALNQAVGKRGLTMVDVGDDRKVSDVLHRRCCKCFGSSGSPLELCRQRAH